MNIPKFSGAMSGCVRKPLFKGSESQHRIKDTPFIDVDDRDWAKPVIEDARKLGIFVGYPDGSFQPGRNLTRRELAAYSMQFLKGIQTGHIPLEPAYARSKTIEALEKRLAALEGKLEKLSSSPPHHMTDGVLKAVSKGVYWTAALFIGLTCLVQSLLLVVMRSIHPLRMGTLQTPRF
jgi:hypothetical protein